MESRVGQYPLHRLTCERIESLEWTRSIFDAKQGGVKGGEVSSHNMFVENLSRDWALNRD